MSNTRDLASKVIYEAFQILKENNDEMQGSELVNELSKRLKLNDWAREVYEKSGFVRWHLGTLKTQGVIA